MSGRRGREGGGRLQGGRRRVQAMLIVLLAGLSAGGCARQVAPSGGEIPETPMSVMATSPDTFAVVEPFDGWVRFTFDRRVSERPTQGGLRDAVVVSPRTGAIEVRHRRQGIDVRMEGGFRDRTVYRVTVLPTLQDLWRNTLGDSYDLFFSTGPEFQPNVLGGLVRDRLTDQVMPGIRVDAEALDEGPLHSAVTDSMGIFTFPYLPADRYRVIAYDDRNRNRQPDFSEPQASLELDLAPGDTLIVTELALLLPDTTAAVLQGVEAVDSITLRLEFDDPIDPEFSLENVLVALSRDEGGSPGVAELLHLHEWEAREAERAADDPDDPDAPPPPPPEPEDPGPVLPAFEFVVILDAPLEPEVMYTVRVEGLENLNGILGGGGEAEVEGPPEPEPPAVPDPPQPPDTVPPRPGGPSGLR
jgi:hypothetical protein